MNLWCMVLKHFLALEETALEIRLLIELLNSPNKVLPLRWVAVSLQGRRLQALKSVGTVE